MMKKILSISLFTFFIIHSQAFAYESYVIMDGNEKKAIAENLPVISEELKELGKLKRKQMKEKGYYETYSENAVSLMSQKDKKAPDYVDDAQDPYHAILRKNPDAFPLSFEFKGFRSVEANQLLGYAPSGTYENNAWTGVTGYFNHEKFGVCRLAIYDMPATHGQAVYDKQLTTFELNGKPTATSVEGNAQSGFFYEISWTGKRYEKTLDCASRTPFNKNLLAGLIEYAKVLDKDTYDTP